MKRLKKININTKLIEEINLIESYEHSPYVDYEIRGGYIEESFFGLIKEYKKAGVYVWDTWTTEFSYKGTVDEVLNKLKHYYIKDNKFYVYPRIIIRFVSGFEKSCYYNTVEEAQEEFDRYISDSMIGVKVFKNKY